LFIVVAFAETIGFGTDAAGLAAFQSSANALGSLAEHYVGRGFAAILVFTAVVSAFACHVSSVTAASRIIFALARDGLGPGRLGLVEKVDGPPRNAAWAVITVSALVDAASYTTRFPSVSAGDPAIEVFFYFGIAGALCLMTVSPVDRSCGHSAHPEGQRRGREMGNRPSRARDFGASSRVLFQFDRSVGRVGSSLAGIRLVRFRLSEYLVEIRQICAANRSV
jgi:hypothetical protein